MLKCTCPEATNIALLSLSRKSRNSFVSKLSCWVFSRRAYDRYKSPARFAAEWNFLFSRHFSFFSIPFKNSFLKCMIGKEFRKRHLKFLMGHPRPLSAYFCRFKKAFYCKNMSKNVHSVNRAGIQTHDLQNMRILP